MHNCCNVVIETPKKKTENPKVKREKKKMIAHIVTPTSLKYPSRASQMKYAKPGDLIMTTAQEIGHPAYLLLGLIHRKCLLLGSVVDTVWVDGVDENNERCIVI